MSILVTGCAGFIGSVATLHRLARADADISMQPGRYGCSTPAIDRIIDVALDTDGVIGAQLAGGGLGGCAMVLVRTESRETLLDRLRRLADQMNGGLCRPARMSSRRRCWTAFRLGVIASAYPGGAEFYLQSRDLYRQRLLSRPVVSITQSIPMTGRQNICHAFCAPI